MPRPSLVPSILALASFSLLGSASWGLEPKGMQDWPQWRGPNRDNYSHFTGISTDWETNPPVLEWKLEGMGSGYASVSIAGNRLYTTGNIENAQRVIAVDLTTHEVVWSTPVTESNPQHDYEGARCTPTIDGDRLYAVTSNGQLSCLTADNGKVVWTKDFKKEWNGVMMSGWGFSESPTIDGDRVLCTPGSPDAMIVALDKATGKEIWRAAAPDQGDKGKAGAGYSSMAISEAGGVKQYVQLIGRGLIGVRASDGKLLWSYNKIANGVADIPTPIVHGDFIFGSSGYADGGSGLIQLVKKGDKFEVREKYYRAANELQNHHGGMILIGDHLYFGHGHNNGFPICVHLPSGKVKWGGKIRGAGNGSAAVTGVDGHVIFRYQSGEVALIEANPTKYKLKGSFKPEVQIRESWAHPVVCDGKLYLREQDTLMCYRLTAK